MARRAETRAGDGAAGGHGLLDGDGATAVGPPCAVVGPPAWIDDDGAVGRRICAKRADPVGADVWWRVTEVARICRRLGYGPAGADRNREFRTVQRALATSLAVADALPWPLPVACTASEPFPRGEATARCADRCRDRVDAAAHRLVEALDDPGWLDPDALAGWVDDAVLALRSYGLHLLAADT